MTTAQLILLHTTNVTGLVMNPIHTMKTSFLWRFFIGLIIRINIGIVCSKKEKRTRTP
jgi:hypothetical protein